MAFQSSNIKLEVLYPVPTEYMGDEQDNDKVGIATYVGLDTLELAGQQMVLI